MPPLSTKARLALPDSAFGLPEQRACPMPHTNHARNVKARVAEEFHKGNLTLAEKQQVDVMADDILART